MEIDEFGIPENPEILGTLQLWGPGNLEIRGMLQLWSPGNQEILRILQFWGPENLEILNPDQVGVPGTIFGTFPRKYDLFIFENSTCLGFFWKWLPRPNHYAGQIRIEILRRKPVSKS